MAVSPEQDVVAVASAAEAVRFFSIAALPAAEPASSALAPEAVASEEAADLAGDRDGGARVHDVLAPIGSIARKAASQRVCQLAFSDCGSSLAACTAGAPPFRHSCSAGSL